MEADKTNDGTLSLKEEAERLERERDEERKREEEENLEVRTCLGLVDSSGRMSSGASASWQSDPEGTRDPRTTQYNSCFCRLQGSSRKS